jgi:4-amino-4-deoxy-L-arabinose transferase-like glycosyltransferase
MSRLHALAIVTLFWAAIFLPALGSVELKGEEGRRIMPAVTMIESGNWIVPYIGGQPYLRKPPLMNWLVAASFKIFGVRNGWTARLPSALSVLALAAIIVCVTSGWIGVESSLIAAIFSMTNLGLLEKGRLAEIESLYIALTGGALVCWLAWRQQDRSRWLVWIAPFVLFGFAMLTKGPPCLLFFYAIAAVVLWREKKLREFTSLPHAIGFLIMLAMFAAWAVPYFRMQPSAMHVWAAESTNRFSVGESFDWLSWLLAVPRGLGNFAPWLALLPLFWSEECLARLADRDAALVCALRWPVVILFFGLLVIPGALPRYTLPMLAPAGVLLALVMHEDASLVQQRVVPIWKITCVALLLIIGVATVAAVAFTRSASVAAVGALAICVLIFKRRSLLNRPLNLALCSAATVACCVSIYSWAIVPRMSAHESVRPVGEFVSRNVPANAQLYACDLRFLGAFPAYHPALFYVNSKVTYATAISELPADADFVFTRAESLVKLRAAGRDVQTLGEVNDRRGRQFILLRLRGATHGNFPSAP